MSLISTIPRQVLRQRLARLLVLAWGTVALPLFAHGEDILPRLSLQLAGFGTLLALAFAAVVPGPRRSRVLASVAAVTTGFTCAALYLLGLHPPTMLPFIVIPLVAPAVVVLAAAIFLSRQH